MYMLSNPVFSWKRRKLSYQTAAKFLKKVFKMFPSNGRSDNWSHLLSNVLGLVGYDVIITAAILERWKNLNGSRIPMLLPGILDWFSQFSDMSFQ